MSIRIVTENIRVVVAVFSLISKVDGLYRVECVNGRPCSNLKLKVNDGYSAEEEMAAAKWLAHNGINITAQGVYFLDEAALVFNLNCGDVINIGLDLLSKMEGERVSLLRLIQLELETLGLWK